MSNPLYRRIECGTFKGRNVHYSECTCRAHHWCAKGRQGDWALVAQSLQKEVREWNIIVITTRLHYSWAFGVYCGESMRTKKMQRKQAIRSVKEWSRSSKRTCTSIVKNLRTPSRVWRKKENSTFVRSVNMPYKCPMCTFESAEPATCPTCKVDAQEVCKSCGTLKSECRC